jgi:hypothetical protein
MHPSPASGHGHNSQLQMSSFVTCDPNKFFAWDYRQSTGQGVNMTNTLQEILFIRIKQELLAVAAKQQSTGRSTSL